jgi:hypothetical protein
MPGSMRESVIETPLLLVGLAPEMKELTVALRRCSSSMAWFRLLRQMKKAMAPRMPTTATPATTPPTMPPMLGPSSPLSPSLAGLEEEEEEAGWFDADVAAGALLSVAADEVVELELTAMYGTAILIPTLKTE